MENKDRRLPENFSAFPRENKNDAYAQYFIGQSYLQLLTKERLVTANVTFEPGCRNNWHIHHKGGQILLVTDGEPEILTFADDI